MVVFLITAVALPLLLTEFGDWCPWLAARLVRWAARHLGDPASCQRYEEEWIANLNEVPGKLGRLVAAFGYLAYMPSMRRSVRRRASRPLSSALPATYRLPLDSLAFVGRVREFEILRRLLLHAAAEDATDRQPIYVVGMGGIGKTALAVFCSTQMKEAFPDGQLFLSAWNREDPGSCLGELLIELGVPASRIPSAQAEKSAMFRACVSGRRVLVVLDDIDEPDQVRALFHGDLPCPVLVTSRQAPNPSLSEGIITLTGLDNDEAHELLRRQLGPRVDAEAEDTARLLNMMAGHPLVINLIIAILAIDPSFTVAGLLLKLDTEMNDNDSHSDGRAVLDNMYYRLPAEQRALLDRLSLLSRAPFGRHQAALLIGATPGDADHLLQNLAVSGWLASVVGEKSRYILHDLVYVYAWEHLRHYEPPERIEVIRGRLTRHDLDPPHP